MTYEPASAGFTAPRALHPHDDPGGAWDRGAIIIGALGAYSLRIVAIGSAHIRPLAERLHNLCAIHAEDAEHDINDAVERGNRRDDMHTVARMSVWVAGIASRTVQGLLLGAAAILTMAGCGGGGGATFMITHAPRFTTCEAGLPAARAGYPAGSYGQASANIVAACGGGPNVSASDTMYTYSKIDTPVATDRVFQFLSEVGVLRTPGTDCGDRITPVIVRLVEYFTVPANDAIVTPNCCEWMYDAAISAQVLVLDTTVLPAAAQAAIPPIAADENAAILDALLTVDQLRDVRDRIQANKQISWGQRYEYDGCNRPPNSTTTCGRTHCQDVWWTDASGTGRQAFSGGR